MNNAKRLLGNTLMLTATSFLMRTVSVSFNVYLTNIIGAQGIGLFQLISTVYAMAITFSVAGIRLAAMRLVADSLALNRTNQRQIMRYCLIYAFFCGSIIAIILFSFSSFVAQKWIGDLNAIAPIKVLCIGLPFVSMSAAFNGYFTSADKIKRYTFVQLLEQIFKIFLTIFLLKSSTEFTIGQACLKIVIGISCAEIFSLFCSYNLYIFTSKAEKDKLKSPIIKNLLRISLPDSIGSEMRSVLTTVEHMLIPKGLKKKGGSIQKAMATYGAVHGMSLPIILYPSVLLSSLSGLLVPEISKHYASGQLQNIHYIIRRVLHLALLFAIGCGGILYFNADRLSIAIYNNPEPGFYIRVLSPLVVVMYMDMSVDGMLKGLDQQMSYMKYNIIDAASCVALVYFLVPVMGVKGYIFVIYASELINFILSFRRLTVVSEVTVEIFKDIVVPLLSAVSSGIIAEFLLLIFNLEFSNKTQSFFCIILSTAIYFFFLTAFNSIDKEEIEWLKKLVFKK